MTREERFDVLSFSRMEISHDLIQEKRIIFLDQMVWLIENWTKRFKPP